MKYLKIKSKGLIQEEAFTLIGASTKKNDETKIGFFGSGAKYSLSALMKNDIKFKVFSGEDEIKFTTKNVSFRDQHFQVIQVNGKDTSLTTAMGGNDWDNSFSYIREIYSNALDEDEDAVLEVTDNLVGEKGYTLYYIELNEDVKRFYENIYNYFCNKNPEVLNSNSFGSIYKGGTTRLFRKGILCYEDENLKALYNYNHPGFRINESRVLSDTWEAKYRVGEIWQKCTDEELIREFIYGIQGGNKGLYEHTIYFNEFESFSMSWGNVLKDLKFVSLEHTDLFEKEDLRGRVVLPFDLLKRFRSQFEDINILGIKSDSDEVFVEKVPTQTLVNKVLDAISLLNKTDYRERLVNPVIKYVKFDKETVLGMANNGEIYLSIKLDTYSVDEICKIIIEENEHNLSGYEDMTRSFQNHLFNLYFEQLKKS